MSSVAVGGLRARPNPESADRNSGSPTGLYFYLSPPDMCNHRAEAQADAAQEYAPFVESDEVSPLGTPIPRDTTFTFEEEHRLRAVRLAS